MPSALVTLYRGVSRVPALLIFLRKHSWPGGLLLNVGFSPLILLNSELLKSAFHENCVTANILSLLTARVLIKVKYVVKMLTVTVPVSWGVHGYCCMVLFERKWAGWKDFIDPTTVSCTECRNRAAFYSAWLYCLDSSYLVHVFTLCLLDQ